MTNNEQLSTNFSLYELCASMTAKLLNIDNTPSKEVIVNLRVLCKEVLQPTRDKWGKPMRITSGYRSKELNKAVGGVRNSYHLSGRAADISVSNTREGSQLAAILLQADLTDEVIIEKHKTRYWVHVQWSPAPRHKLITNYEV